MERSHKASLEEASSNAYATAEQATDRFKRQLREVEQKLQERDKHMEALQILHAQDLESVEQRKDQEIASL